MDNTKKFTESEIADRIVIQSRGLGADIVDGNVPNEIILLLANGQTFAIQILDITE